jgi:hypothetical protein
MQSHASNSVFPNLCEAAAREIIFL